MTALTSYSTGTISVSADGTTVTGVGTIWSGSNVKQGDRLDVGHFSALIVDVVDVTHLTITRWPGSTLSGANYDIWPNYPQRVSGVDILATMNRQVAALETSGYFVFVGIDATEPDPSLGNDGQFAFQPTTGKTWERVSGVWTYLGVYKAFNLTGAYDNATVYAYGDVQTTSGSSYIYINDTPSAGHTAPNATYWQLLASKGDTGGAGPVPLLPIAAWLTATNYITGPPASFVSNNGSSYQCLVSHTSGTFATDLAAGKWGLVAQKGAGDLSSANNLSDVASVDTARANLKVDSGKNYLLNPSGEIDQFVVSGGASRSDAAYDFDQWLTLAQSSPLTISSVADAENTTPLMMRSLQANATAQRFGRIQWIEAKECRELRGRAVTLSSRVRMSASTTLRFAIVEWTGTADAITKDVVGDWTNGTFTAGQFFTSTSTTIVATGSQALTANTLANISLSGTVSGSMNNLAVIFWTDSTQAQNVTLDIGKCKLEVGSVATPFAAPRLVDEFPRCLRYFCKSFGLGVAPAQNAGFTGALVAVSATTSAGSISFRQYWPVRMRGTPTVTTYNTSAADANWWDANASASRLVGLAEQSENSARIVMNATTTAGSQHFIHWTADSRL